MKTVTISQEEYNKFKAQEQYISELEQREKWLKEQILLLKKAQFGSKSERATYLKQLSIDNLFDEAEVFSDPEQEEPKFEEVINVPAHTRKKKSVIERLPEDIPVVERHHYVDAEGRTCPHCSAEMEEIGTETRSTLGMAPAKVFEIRDICHVYACKACDKEAEPVTVRKATFPAAVIPGGIASPEAIANVINDKFVQGTPLYRQEQYWQRVGVMLSRQTMSNWLMYSVEHYLRYIYDKLHQDLLQEDILHADETELQVLQEEGKSPQSKSYMWLYRTGVTAANPIVLFHYERDRRHCRPQEFLEGFQGYLHSDGYEAYHKLENVRSVGCFVHVRRKFVEAAETASKNKGSLNLAGKAVEDIRQIFAWEDFCAKMSAEERYEKRLAKQKPLMEKFFEWLEDIVVSEKSALGIARKYALGQKDYILNVYLDGRLELNNNRAERSIKPFVIGRKNFLFANTPRGATASAILYSLVETAKETGVDPYSYLVYTLTEAAKLRDTDEFEKIAELTPAYFKNLG
ncbi:MAG: IS66 family transposase [Saccharofermentanales bacterium]